MQAMLDYVKATLFVPGPKKPSCMDSYRWPVDQEWHRLAVEGVQVTPAVEDPVTGQVSAGSPFCHRAFLTGIAADSPARATLQHSVGCFIAVLACMHCGLTADRVAGVYRYPGYSAATVASCGPRKGASFVVGANDAERQYKPAEMMHLAKAAETVRQAGGDAARTLGVHGLASPLKQLWYLPPDALFIVPFAHMGVHGVFKDWLKAVFGKPQRRGKRRPTAGAVPAGMGNGSCALPPRNGRVTGQQQQQQHSEQQAGGAADAEGAAAASGVAAVGLPLPSSKTASAAARRLISARAAGVVAHPQCGRNYTDVVQKHRQWTMEEAMRAPMWFTAMLAPAETISGHKQLLDPVVKKGYGHLRRWLAFHLQARSFASQDEFVAAAREAEQDLLEYARLAQEDFCLPGEEPTWRRKSALCTYNLHQSICWLPKQVMDRGLTAFNLELWVERFLGWLVRRTKFRLHGRPEAIIVKTYLIGCALQRFKWKLQLQLHKQQQQQQQRGQLPPGDPEQQQQQNSAPDSDSHGHSTAAPFITSVQQLRKLVGARKAAAAAAAGGSSSSCSSRLDGDEEACGCLLGLGQRLKPGVWDTLQGGVRRCLIANGVWGSDWEGVWPDVHVWKHSSARLVTGREVTSVAYTRSRSRDGTHFLIYFEAGRGATATTTPQAAQAEFFLRLQHPTDSSQVFRLTVASLCELRSCVPDPDLSSLLLEGKRGAFKQRSYPVLLECIEAACAMVDRSVLGPDGCKVVWRNYVPIEFSSKCAKGARQYAGG